MKKLAIFVATAILASAPAYAADTVPPASTAAPKGEKVEGKRVERFKSADTNADGALSREEFLANAASRAVETFTKIDKDGNGSATREEMKAYGDEMRAKFKEGNRPE